MAESAIRVDIPIMIACLAALLPVIFTGFEIRRWEGALFVALYVAYIGYLLMNATGHERLPDLLRGDAVRSSCPPSPSRWWRWPPSKPVAGRVQPSPSPPTVRRLGTDPDTEARQLGCWWQAGVVALPGRGPRLRGGTRIAPYERVREGSDWRA